MDPTLVDLVSDPPRLVYPDGSWCPTTRTQARIEAFKILFVSPHGDEEPRAEGAAVASVQPAPLPAWPLYDSEGSYWEAEA